MGEPPTNEELECSHWMDSGIFSSGIENENLAVECLSELSYVTE